jgi:type III secretory pathway component EscV
MKFDVYCDESSPDLLYHREASKYSLIGSLWLPHENRTEFKQSVTEIKEKHHYYSEIKWKKVSNNHKDFFIDLINYFFETEFLRFRSIVIESDKIDLVKFNKGDAELGFYKFYYQLLHHWLLDFNEYNIFLDYKTDKERFRINDLWKALNNSNFTTSISNVQSLPSKQSLGIQFTDLMLGAINGKFNSGVTSEAKLSIISKIEELLKREISPTGKNVEKFNVFKINLQGGW